MPKLRLKIYLSCIAFGFFPVIVSPASAISNQSAISPARKNYPSVIPIEGYPSEGYLSMTPIPERNVKIKGADVILAQAVGTAASSAFDQAVKLGKEADEQTKAATNSEDWGNVSRQWLKAIELLQKASKDEAQHSESLQKIEEFQRKFTDSARHFFALSSREKPTSAMRLPAAVQMSMPTLPLGAAAMGAPPAFQKELGEYNQKELKELGKYNEELGKYNAWILTHRKNTFRLSLYSSIAIFALVVVIVIAGILLSYEQLRKGLSSETKFSVKEGAVEINSSIIGLLVLFLSLAFFYLYLKEVYPIHEVGLATENRADVENKNQINR